MGIWVKCKNRMLEVTSFKINEKNMLNDDGTALLYGEGILLYSADAEILAVDYKSERHAQLVFDRLVDHIGRLEILSRCVKSFDPDILNEDNDDEVSLDALCDLMIFNLPADKDDDILKEMIKHSPSLNLNIDSKKETKEVKKDDKD